MEIIYKAKALNDIKLWKNSGNLSVQKKISKLISDIQLHPEKDIGKPEELKYELSGLWSREIDKKNQLIYEIKTNAIHILSMRGHYFDK